MRFSLKDEGTTLVVALEGQLIFAAHDDFQRLLAQIERTGANRRVVFDFSAVTHLDSVGLGLLNVSREDLARQGSTVVLAHAHGPVRRLFDLTDLGQLFEIIP